ncbi:hypothetical protein [Ralstonia pseudosolanacearum]|uniref:hypothetical protein n=1 Tax=Ralstonia pseudosolanacearum TaxID=1310165 RepID=UPI002675BD27|nr:hypothetical protein [Ralstonia pseudosolanacearum]MDO3535936.1 hypothetical protein [Ralstonia pseudosolanacearum]
MSHLTLVATNPSLTRKTTAAGRTLLSEFLAAELAPGISIEKACYPSVVLFELRCQPTPHELAKGRCLLQGAGLVYLEEDPFEPGYIVLDAPLKFAEKFPHLKHVIPFVLHSKRVWVLSGSTPIAHPGLAIVQ